jgi:hypothetical protein
MRILVACEFSATVRNALLARGHDAWSCDLLPTEGRAANHIIGDVPYLQLAEDRIGPMLCQRAPR